jgi:hypothetical protein
MDTRPVPPVSVTVASMLSILASVGVLIVGLLCVTRPSVSITSKDWVWVLLFCFC